MVSLVVISQLTQLTRIKLFTNSTTRQKLYNNLKLVEAQIKNNPTTSYLDSSSVSTKRQTKRPKKVCVIQESQVQYTQNEDTIYHYNTRSKTAEASAPVEKEPEQVIQYCICGQPENDNMVECENTECKHKWFHYSCVGITDPDSLPAKWYCPDCAASHTD